MASGPAIRESLRIRLQLIGLTDKGISFTPQFGYLQFL